MHISVQDAKAAIESGDEERFGDGFEKTIRTKPPRDDRRGKNKTPRTSLREGTPPPTPIVLAESPAPAAVLSVVSTAKPSEEKKGEVKGSMKTAQDEKNGNTTLLRKVVLVIDREICPRCGKKAKSPPWEKEDGTRVPYLICKGCTDAHNLYKDEAENNIVAGDTTIEIKDKFAWLLPQLEAMLPGLVENHTRALAEYQGLHAWAIGRAQEYVRAQKKPVEIEEVRSLIAKYESSELTKRRDAAKTAFAWRNSVEKLIPELKRKIAEAAKRAAEDTVAATSETITAKPAELTTAEVIATYGEPNP